MSDRSEERAPSLAEIEAIAFAAFAQLPEGFRRLCVGVRIHVDDFPDDETLDEMACESEFDLLGLFRGTGLAQAGETATGQMPNPSGSIAGRSSTTGPNTTRASGTSSATSSSTRSGIISGCRTRTWRGSRDRPMHKAWVQLSARARSSP